MQQQSWCLGGIQEGAEKAAKGLRYLELLSAEFMIVAWVNLLRQRLARPSAFLKKRKEK